MTQDTTAATIAHNLKLQLAQVTGCLALLDEGATVPFIARYRKERTNGLDEVQIRDVAEEAARLRALEERRAAILKGLAEQGIKDEALLKAVRAADELTRLEDLWAPYRPKRQTRAQKAIEAGLTPLADAIAADSNDLERTAQRLICKEFADVDAVLAGACDILAERVADDAEARASVRRELNTRGKLVSKKRRGAEEDPRFANYVDFEAPTSRLRPHQVLAIRRGEQEKKLSSGIEVDDARLIESLRRRFNDARRPKPRELWDVAVEDGYKRLLKPGVERDARGKLEEDADARAIEVFALNVKQLLMQPPMPARRIMGLDPGFRTGCKIAIVDEVGALLTTAQIYIHDARAAQAPSQIAALCKKHKVELIAIGNGTASRESEEIVAQTVKQVGGVQYAIVDEAGASVYSASDVAREEFPELDVSMRGAVSIARRLQDPLAELVKIDPRSIGVGMYQHDVNQDTLTRKLAAVVEDVVNRVGVDLNSASAPLLTHVAGIGAGLAKRIVEQRSAQGAFARRDDLLKVKGLGPKTFEQCAGFVRVRGADPLDATGIHPERYPLARAILKAAGGGQPGPSLTISIAKLDRDGTLTRLAAEHKVGKLTMDDLLAELQRPGRDPREELDPPMLRADVLSMDDLREGMWLVGTVRNVVDFGAFVDLGVKQDGLVHISELADGFIKNPYEVVSVGDRVRVRVLEIDAKRKRIALSMKSAQ
jgi:protein Tex